MYKMQRRLNFSPLSSGLQASLRVFLSVGVDSRRRVTARLVADDEILLMWYDFGCTGVIRLQGELIRQHIALRVSWVLIYQCPI